MKSLFLSDRCLDPEVLTYDLPGSCRSFWACDGGESIPMCCPYGTSYHSGIGCLPDNKCKDPCPPRPTQHLNPRAIMSDKINPEKIAPLSELSLPGDFKLGTTNEMHVLQLIRGKGERKFSRLTYSFKTLTDIWLHSTIHVYDQIPFYKIILRPILKTSYRPPSTFYISIDFRSKT